MTGWIVGISIFLLYIVGAIWNYGRVNRDPPYDGQFEEVGAAIFWPFYFYLLALLYIGVGLRYVVPKVWMALSLNTPFVLLERTIRAIYSNGKKHRNTFPEM